MELKKLTMALPTLCWLEESPVPGRGRVDKCQFEKGIAGIMLQDPLIRAATASARLLCPRWRRGTPLATSRKLSTAGSRALFRRPRVFRQRTKESALDLLSRVRR